MCTLCAQAYSNTCTYYTLCDKTTRGNRLRIRKSVNRALVGYIMYTNACTRIGAHIFA